MKRSLYLPKVMRFSSCKLPFPDIIISLEVIVCIIKCKVLCNINGQKNPAMAMKIQNGCFTFHYAVKWLDSTFLRVPPDNAGTVLRLMRREWFFSLYDGDGDLSQCLGFSTFFFKGTFVS